MPDWWEPPQIIQVDIQVNLMIWGMATSRVCMCVHGCVVAVVVGVVVVVCVGRGGGSANTSFSNKQFRVSSQLCRSNYTHLTLQKEEWMQWLPLMPTGTAIFSRLPAIYPAFVVLPKALTLQLVVSRFRSCAYRDTVSERLSCDVSWLSTNPINPLSIGQFVNNQTRGNSSEWGL